MFHVFTFLGNFWRWRSCLTGADWCDARRRRYRRQGRWRGGRKSWLPGGNPARAGRKWCHMTKQIIALAAAAALGVGTFSGVSRAADETNRIGAPANNVSGGTMGQTGAANPDRAGSSGATGAGAAGAADTGMSGMQAQG